MNSFKTYLDEQEMLKKLEAQYEALNVQQRLKLKRSIIRNKAKLRMGQKRAERRIANQEVLKKRAMRLARSLMLKRFLKNKDKSELSYAQRETYEKMLEKRKTAIKRLAQKLLPKIRKLEIQRKTAGGGPRTLNLTATGSPAPAKTSADKKPAE